MKYGCWTHDSSTDCSRSWFLPWTQWRHVRRTVYNCQGEHYADIPEWKGVEGWEKVRDIEETSPTLIMKFRDFEGKELTATTRIEERQWGFGTGWFKWLSWFRSPK